MLRAEERFLADSPLQIRKATVQLSMEGGSLRFWCQQGGVPLRGPAPAQGLLMLKGSFRETVGNRWVWTVHVWVLITSFLSHILPSMLMFSIRLWNVVKPLIARCCLTFLKCCRSKCKKKKKTWDGCNSSGFGIQTLSSRVL